MQTHDLFIIGDRFAGFARKDDVLTISQVRQVLTRRRSECNPEPLRLHLGQGVSAYDRKLLDNDIRRCELTSVDVVEGSEELAGRREVHKNRETNVLIANLVRDGDVYRADLRIHNDNELLLDHQTGLHVQGMIITEAARQMFLAVSETWLAPSTSDYEYYYVIETMATTYENFLFPLPAQMIFRTRELSGDNTARTSVDCSIELHQANRRCAITDVRYTAFAPGLIGDKETRRADYALSASLEAARGDRVDVVAGV